MTTAYVDGEKHTFPDEMSQEQIGNVLRQSYPSEAVQEAAPVAQEAIKEDISWLDRMAGGIDEAQLGIQDTLANQTGQLQLEQVTMGEEPNRSIGTEEAAVQYTGDLARVMAQTGEAAISEGFQELDDWSGGVLSDGAYAFLQSNIGKAGVKLFNSGSKMWESFKKQYPEGAKTIAGATEAGLLGFSKPKMGPVSQMLAPPDKRGGKQQTTESTWLRARQYHPNQREQDVAKITAEVPGIDPKRSYTRNHEMVENNVAKRRLALDAGIVKAGNPEFDRKNVLQNLSDKVEWLDTLDEATVLSGNAQSMAEKMLVRAQQFIQESDGTALGLLNARRQFDKWVDDNSGGSGALDTDAINAKTVARRVVRDEINDTVAELVPDVKVKESLLNQSRLLSAKDILFDKMASEGENVIARFIQGVSQGHVGPVGAMAIGSGITGLVSKFATDSVGFAAGGLGGGAALLMTLSRPERRRILGAAMQWYDGQIQEDPENVTLVREKEVLRDMLNLNLEE